MFGNRKTRYLCQTGIRLPGMTVGFTLIELLVANVVLVLLLFLFSQVLTQTSASTRAADQKIDTATMCRVAFDRLGIDLGAMARSSETSLFVIKGDGQNIVSDSVVMVGNVRTQDRGIAPGNLRFGTIAYTIRRVNDPALGLTGVPMLCRGNGTITWSGTNATQVSSDSLNALKLAIDDVTNSTENMVQFQPLAEGGFRCCISFLLSDGTLTDLPPKDKNFTTLNTGTNVVPVALNAAASADSSQRYVKALVVGIVALDQKTLQQLGANGSVLTDLAKKFTAPASDPSTHKLLKTAAQTWSITDSDNASLRATLSPPNYPAPVLRGVQVYQRYFYVQ